MKIIRNGIADINSRCFDIPSQVVSQNKRIVRTIYEHLVRNNLEFAKSFFRGDYRYDSPQYLPWGGSTCSAEQFLCTTAPQMARYLDYTRFGYLRLIAEDTCVVALYKVGVVDSASDVIFCDQWGLEGGAVRSTWSSIFEPLPLLVAIEQLRGATELMR